jgi:AsmA protein
MLRALNGNGSFNIANGAIRGVNLVGMAQTALSTLTRGASTGEETAFGSLTGTFTIGNGIVRNNDLRLSSGVAPVEGAGTINLPEETVDYRLTVQIAGQVPVPVVVTGPISNLSYRPDLTNALESVAKNPALLQKLVPGSPAAPAPGAKPPNHGALLNNLLRR